MFFNIFSKNDFSNISHFKKILLVLITYMLLVVCIVFSMILISWADNIVKALGYESIVNIIALSNKEIRAENFYVVVFIVPILEEILFRLILLPKRENISVFILFLSFYVLNGNFTTLNFSETHLYVNASISVLLSIIFYKNYKLYGVSVERKTKILIVFSIILFGLAHISNIKPFHSELILLYPFFIIPQMIMGYFISNIRIKLGFFWGVLIHCLINFISLYL